MESTIAIECARDSLKVTLYSSKFLGATLDKRDKSMRVDSVAHGSPASKAGMRRGDLLVPAASGLDNAERAERQNLAKFGELTVRIRRDGRELPLILSFPD
jgi:predicted metalloprotease with PDZ domain